MPLIGPLYGWELARLARRGQDAKSRVILAFALLGTMIIFAMIWFRTFDLPRLLSGTDQLLEIQESARFAEQFALSLLLAQLAVLGLLAPAYAAGSIAEEKELQSWAFLLSTPLSNREIVLGKYTARVTFLLGVLLAGLPVMALTAMLGGIDLLTLLAGYAVTASCVVLIGALSLLAAIYSSNYRITMIRAYVLTALFMLVGGGAGFFLSPFAVIITLSAVRADLPRFFTIGGVYIAMVLLAAVILLAISIRRVRRQDRMRKSPAARPAALPLHPPNTDNPKLPSRPNKTDSFVAVAAIRRPGIGNGDPFEWKLRYFRGERPSRENSSSEGLLTLGSILGGTMLIMFLTLSYFAAASDSSGTSARWLTIAGSAALFVHLLRIGPATFGGLIREKRRKTLESLLVLPVERQELLLPLWYFAFQHRPGFLILAALAIGMGYLQSGLVLAAVPAGLCAVASAAFAVSFALWLGVCLQVFRQAMVAFVAVGGILALIPIIVHLTAEKSNQPFSAVIAVGVLAVITMLSRWFWKLAVKTFKTYGQV